MALVHSFEKSGNFLFKYRGQIPAIIFLIALPVVFYKAPKLLFFSFSSKFHIFLQVITVFSVIVSLIGIIIRAYAIGTTPHGTSGRNRDKQLAKQLNTQGIYSIVRHPLYLGNYFMWAGLLMFTYSVSLFLVVSLVFWLYYERIMFAEERYLERQFGEEYLDWSQRVPAFIPRFRQFQKSTIPFSLKTVLRREYSGVFALVLGFTLVDYTRNLGISYFFKEPMQWVRPSLWVLLAFLLLMLTLRTLKHHTNFLNRMENRD